MDGERSDQEHTEDDLHYFKEIKVDRKQEPMRLDKFLMNRLDNVSRNRVQSAIKVGSITVDDKEIKPNFKVKAGNIIKVLIPHPPDQAARLIPQRIPLDIVYEDEDVLLVHKPAGMVVHPGIGHRKGTLVNALAYYLNIDNAPAVTNNYQDRVGLVHRIDKDTSGLLVVAKNEYAVSHLTKQFYHHTIERTYYALVWGEPEPERGTIEANVGRHPRHRRRFTTFPEGEEGKWAVTHYEVLEPLYYVSLIKCNLETGRTHQIRVHMKDKGHPLFSDALYGGHEIMKGTVYSKYKLFVDRMFAACPRQALHAKSLGFVHPRTGIFMQFDTDLPPDMQNAMDGWRRYVDAKRASKKDKDLNA